MIITAILFDTRSIQKYIFSSNRLKMNIGASYLVERLFDDHLLSILKDLLPGCNTDFTSCEARWQNLSDESMVAYIGGGNALVLLQEGLGEDKAREIVSAFTKRLLTECPGAKTGAAIGTLYLDRDGNYLTRDGEPDISEDNCLTQLVRKLKEYQNRVYPAVNVPYTGLTISCTENGEAATAYYKERFYSFEAVVKLKVAAKAEKKLENKLTAFMKENIFEEYAFPVDFDQLGQKEEENYLAIVHIDGNNMGKKFSGCSSLAERRRKSVEVSGKTTEAFAGLIQDIEKEYGKYKEFLELGYERTDKESGDKNLQQRKYLPIRPIVIGGDDVTFVCAAKLALRFAENFMRKMLKSGIDTCAGIAILKTSYPFFRGYELVEQLCSKAKTSSRRNDGSAWLDFAILHGEQAPTLEQIRRQEYRAAAGNMHFGPYWVAGGTEEPVKTLANLKTGTELFGKLPHSKIKELRRVIARSENERRIFVTQLKHLGYNLPQVDGWKKYEAAVWSDKETPYVDAIEMMDFYEVL